MKKILIGTHNPGKFKEISYLISRKYRKISPLMKANDAIEIITDGYSINEVADKIIDLYNDKIPKEIQMQ